MPLLFAFANLMALGDKQVFEKLYQLQPNALLHLFLLLLIFLHYLYGQWQTIPENMILM